MPRSFPSTFSRREGLVEGKTYRSLRFNSDVGKHGDTGTSEVEALRAVLDGRADAAAIGSPFWDRVRSGAARAGGRAHRDLDLAAVQSLHVHGAARISTPNSAGATSLKRSEA